MKIHNCSHLTATSPQSILTTISVCTKPKLLTRQFLDVEDVDAKLRGHQGGSGRRLQDQDHQAPIPRPRGRLNNARGRERHRGRRRRRRRPGRRRCRGCSPRRRGGASSCGWAAAAAAAPERRREWARRLVEPDAD